MNDVYQGRIRRKEGDIFTKLCGTPSQLIAEMNRICADIEDKVEVNGALRQVSTLPLLVRSAFVRIWSELENELVAAYKGTDVAVDVWRSRMLLNDDDARSIFQYGPLEALSDVKFTRIIPPLRS